MQDAKQENQDLFMKIGGLGFLTESMRSELEPIKKRHVETVYMERAIEELEKQVNELKGSLNSEISGVKTQISALFKQEEDKMK